MSTSTPVLLLTIEDVAASLQVSRRTIDSLLASGQLPSVNIGRSRRITTEALREFASKGVNEVVKAGLGAIAEGHGPHRAGRLNPRRGRETAAGVVAVVYEP